jgi:ectoine hydroxylase-related dioxygenase (phytanoyl-CoA dioxygenase family)
MPELQRLTAASEQETLWRALEQDGAVVVEGLVAPALLDRLCADFQPHLDAVPYCNTGPGELSNEFFGLQTKRLHGLLARSQAFAELIQSPLLLEMAKVQVGPNARDLRLSTGELMALGPGETPQMLHRDADSWLQLPAPRPEILASANVALTPFTEHNGATVVVPGSHRWPRERKAEPEDCVLACMPRGAALLYGGEVLHGGGRNETDALRIGLYVGYLASWLRPIENHLITNGPEVVRAAPEPVRRLLDWTADGWTPLA